MGKRQIGELQPSELVITILVSNIATLPLEDLNIPLVMGILPILSLVCFEVIMSWLSLKSKRLRHAVSGSPKVIIRDGVLDQKVMEDLRFSVDDLMTALRGNSVFDIADVQFAIVETNGSVSVYEKYAQRNVKNTDLNLTGTSMDPPVIIVSDGKLITQGLNETGLKKQWVYDLIERKHMELSDIFLLTADKNGTYNLIKRSSGK
jgi:uncharacterized membrane protein YcaP (DUF421 family)